MRKPFEGDRFIHAEVMRLCAFHDIQTIIETGTEHGVTTAAMAEFVPRVLTAEMQPGYRTLAHKPNVEQFIGDSGIVIRSLILLATQPILFYLDAHDAQNCPLLKELEAIETNVRDKVITPPIIVIHDFKSDKYPERGYDTINTFGIHAIVLEWSYIEEVVKRIYTEPKPYMLERCEGASRGALFLVP